MVHATDIVCSSTRLSHCVSSRPTSWMGVAFFTTNVAKVFAVWSAWWVCKIKSWLLLMVVGNMLQPFRERAVSCPSLSVLPAHSPVCYWVWPVLLVSRFSMRNEDALFCHISSSDPVFLGLVVIAVCCCFRFAFFVVSWRKACSKTSISDGFD